MKSISLALLILLLPILATAQNPQPHERTSIKCALYGSTVYSAPDILALRKDKFEAGLEVYSNKNFNIQFGVRKERDYQPHQAQSFSHCAFVFRLLFRFGRH